MYKNAKEESGNGKNGKKGHYLDGKNGLVTNWRFVDQRERRLLQDQVQLGIGAMVQL